MHSNLTSTSSMPWSMKRQMWRAAISDTSKAEYLRLQGWYDIGNTCFVHSVSRVGSYLRCRPTYNLHGDVLSYFRFSFRFYFYCFNFIAKILIVILDFHKQNMYSYTRTLDEYCQQCSVDLFSVKVACFKRVISAFTFESINDQWLWFYLLCTNIP